MPMLDDFGDATRELLAVLGEPVSVVRAGADPVTFLAFVDQAVQDIGQRARVYSNKRVVAMMPTDWTPVRGDEFTVRGRTGKVETIYQDDGLVVTVTLNG